MFYECDARVQTAIPSMGNYGNWRTLGGADSIVLVLAENCDPDYIATSDDGLLKSNMKSLIA